MLTIRIHAAAGGDQKAAIGRSVGLSICPPSVKRGLFEVRKPLSQLPTPALARSLSSVDGGKEARLHFEGRHRSFPAVRPCGLYGPSAPPVLARLYLRRSGGERLAVG